MSQDLVNDFELPGKKDPLFWDALEICVEMKVASTSALQRRLRIGYGRAASIIDAMAVEGYVGKMDSTLRAYPVFSLAFEVLKDRKAINSVES